MKYTKLKFDYEKFSTFETDSMNSYTKNRLYNNNFMYVDTDKLKEGKEKFKKELLKYHKKLIDKIENNI